MFAPVVASIAAVILYHYFGKEYLGAEENKYWNKLRVSLLAAGDSTVRQKTGFALTNDAGDHEFVTTVKADSNKFAELLEDAGYLQCVLAGLKYRPPDVNPNTSSQVRFEDGSMAYRESKSSLVPDALALRQVHIFWFDNGDGSVDFYAHEEYSSPNPLVAWKHYRAVDWNIELGMKIAQDVLENAGHNIDEYE